MNFMLHVIFGILDTFIHSYFLGLVKKRCRRKKIVRCDECGGGLLCRHV